ncbi:hypothetical protein K490DRAFT_47008 [Saccharata proteae CBS 121410]|uniref:SH3 domain signaling protein n=1 Tax=Saccharata proteae CBS 121410 TaxID=1314787 RepID=A0A9P4HSN7_9PEZI|nr:hypothetical protein K490DRAFT_47008 [Saccharata proteae CBS 121410]
MQRVQRKIGSFMKRSDDEADIGTILAEFKEADLMLGKLVDATKAWRSAWTEILNHQVWMSNEYNNLYSPIVGASEAHDFNGHQPVDTPAATLERATSLKDANYELKSDMMEEIGMIEQRLVRPAREAKESIKPLFKTIKHREDRKLDYERYKSRVDSLEKKVNRSARDDASLEKQQIDLERATTDYENADFHIRQRLPPVTRAILSLLPHLLDTTILIQNHILGNLYTVQHEYCEHYGFPSPAPEMEEVVAIFDGSFTPLRKEIETGFNLLSSTKVVHQPMNLPDKSHSTLTGLNLRNHASTGITAGRSKFANARGSTGSSPQPTQGRLEGPPSHQMIEAPQSPDPHQPPPVDLASRPKIPSGKPRVPSSSNLSPYDGNATPSWQRRPSTASSAVSNGSDYFVGRPASSTSSTPGGGNLVATPLQGLAAGIGNKKKPPPPPPKKKFDTHQRDEFVVAVYDFDATQHGDLSFREGDRIKIIKKTPNTQDWWEGELRGAKGSFPANYCQAG